jgi:hypothetical protein
MEVASSTASGTALALLMILMGMDPLTVWRMANCLTLIKSDWQSVTHLLTVGRQVIISVFICGRFLIIVWSFRRLTWSFLHNLLVVSGRRGARSTSWWNCWDIWMGWSKSPRPSDLCGIYTVSNSHTQSLITHTYNTTHNTQTHIHS